MEEIWKDIKNYETYYQVSNLGNVRSLDRHILRKGDKKKRLIRGCLMTPVLTTDGYLSVKLTRDNHAVSYRIHRLVAEAFIPNTYDLPEVNHIDMCKSNNRVDNLEWCTHIDNVRHSAAHGKYKHYGSDNPNYGNHTLHYKYLADAELCKKNLSRPRGQNGRAKQIILYDTEHKLIGQFKCITDCADYLIKNSYSTNSLKTTAQKIGQAVAIESCTYQHYYKPA